MRRSFYFCFPCPARIRRFLKSKRGAKGAGDQDQDFNGFLEEGGRRNAQIRKSPVRYVHLQVIKRVNPPWPLSMVQRDSTVLVFLGPGTGTKDFIGHHFFHIRSDRDPFSRLPALLENYNQESCRSMGTDILTGGSWGAVFLVAAGRARPEARPEWQRRNFKPLQEANLFTSSTICGKTSPVFPWRR